MSQPSTNVRAIPYACSVTGKVRDHNEDAVLSAHWGSASPGPFGLTALLAVADGMGGHQAGEWASNRALMILKEYIALANQCTPIETVLHDAVITANKEIYASSDGTGLLHPGTTLTVVAIKDNHCIVAHVGDSRAYLLRDGALQQLTEDDSWAAELVRQGQMTPDAASNWLHKNQLTKAVGIRDEVEPSVQSHDFENGDIILLCSDGLHGMISDEKIRSILLDVQSAVQAGEALCAAANRAGGEDNISVILYSYGSWRPSRGGCERRPVYQEHSSYQHITNQRRKNTAVGIGMTRRHGVAISYLQFLIIVLIALLLGAGLRLLTYKPQQTNSDPAKQLSTVTLMMRDGKLQVLSSNCIITGEPINNEGWDSKERIYTFRDYEASKKLINENGINFALRGPSNADLTRDGNLSWTANITRSGRYDIIWSVDGTVKGRFLLRMK
ncbi:MAG TPA: PP2C family serine/threonine-protein phosphatase [Armatimonadota bacterium]|nr:PP2C family serine/threonine-protein phosphatase [Armatimonadota bacterium]